MTRTHKTISDLLNPETFEIQPPPAPSDRSRKGIESLHRNLLLGLEQAQVFSMPDVEQWSKEDWIAVSNTIEDLSSLGLFRLPYPVCLLEFEHAGLSVLAVEHDDGRIGTQMFATRTPADMLDGNPTRTVICGAITWLKAIEAEPGDWRVECRLTQDYDTDKPLTQALIDSIGSKSGEAVGALIVLLLTKGVKKELVEAPTKLNKARLKKGRIPIREYTRITIQDAEEGERAIRDPNDPRRASPRPHLRRGHVNGRNGKRWFVAPMLVSAATADDSIALTREYRVKTTLRKAS
jgi:hypothetical protein